MEPGRYESVEDAYDHLVVAIADKIRRNSDKWKTLFVADCSTTDEVAFALSTVAIFKDGIWEQRKYDPETLRSFPEPKLRLLYRE
jgi:hypothetical protein